jgi:F-type H+-transporting ATPase subunit b
VKSKAMKCILSGLLLFCALIFSLLYSYDALAAEGLTPSRRLWDNIMLVVNFLILVFLFIKYARKPLMDYLRGERSKLEENLNAIDGRLNEVKSGIEEESEKLKGIDKQIKEIQDRVMEMASREKNEIIEEAKIAAQKMIQDAKVYADYRVAKARKALSDEMVDIALSMAEERLVKAISQEDSERLTEQFIRNLGTSKRHFD